MDLKTIVIAVVIAVGISLIISLLSNSSNDVSSDATAINTLKEIISQEKVRLDTLSAQFPVLQVSVDTFKKDMDAKIEVLKNQISNNTLSTTRNDLVQIIDGSNLSEQEKDNIKNRLGLK